jgi:hypothetical protein
MNVFSRKWRPSGSTLGQLSMSSSHNLARAPAETPAARDIPDDFLCRKDAPARRGSREKAMNFRLRDF